MTIFRDLRRVTTDLLDVKISSQEVAVDEHENLESLNSLRPGAIDKQEVKTLFFGSFCHFFF